MYPDHLEHLIIICALEQVQADSATASGQQLRAFITTRLLLL